MCFGLVRERWSGREGERERKEALVDNARQVCLFLVEAGGDDKGHARLTAGSVAEQGGRACPFGDDQPGRLAFQSNFQTYITMTFW
jgi:hypothetical protein